MLEQMPHLNRVMTNSWCCETKTAGPDWPVCPIVNANVARTAYATAYSGCMTPQTIIPMSNRQLKRPSNPKEEHALHRCEKGGSGAHRIEIVSVLSSKFYSKHCTMLRLASDGLTHEVLILRLLQTDLARTAHPDFPNDVPNMAWAQSLTDSILVTARP